MISISPEQMSEQNLPDILDTCPQCRGVGHMYVVLDPNPTDYLIGPTSDIPDPNSTIKTERHTCDRCEGSGRVKLPYMRPAHLYQNDRFIGVCSDFAPRFMSTILFAPRVGDVNIRVRDGRITYDISDSLGPGDLKHIIGFIPDPSLQPE